MTDYNYETDPKKLSITELIRVVTELDSLIYETECFSTGDMTYLNLCEKELAKRKNRATNFSSKLLNMFGGK
jgi:hypothetical protein